MSSSKAVEDCLIHRVRTQHLDLLIKYGATLVLEAIQNRAQFLYDLEEIGSSDISCWMQDVIEDLARESA